MGNLCSICQMFAAIQVDASDMRILSLPSIDVIRKIGGCILQNLPQIDYEIDTIVAHMLELDSKSMSKLIERTKDKI
jgi:hypothetical protein